MKLITSLSKIKDIEKINDLVDGIIIEMAGLTYHADNSFSLSKILEIRNLYSKEIFINLDIIASNLEIKKLDKIIPTLGHDFFYLVSDVGVFQLFKKHHLERNVIINIPTLTCNYQDFNAYASIGCYGVIPSLEITLSDLELISQNKTTNFFYYGLVRPLMSVSRRPLLSNYSEYRGLDISLFENKNLTINEKMHSSNYPIYENKLGTSIYRGYLFSTLTHLYQINPDYVILDSEFIDYKLFMESILVFSNYIKDINYDIKPYLERNNKYFEDGFFYSDSKYIKGGFGDE